jgi:hypothetical protein
MYWLNYLDRNAIALARLNDLEEDLNLDSTQYQTCVSILFIGYLLGQVSNILVRTACETFTDLVHQHLDPLQHVLDTDATKYVAF